MEQTANPITFFVPGTPIPKGSMNGRVTRAKGRPIAMVYDQQGRKLKNWQEAIKWAAIAHRRAPVTEARQAFRIRLVFQFPRPKNQLTSRGKRTVKFRPLPTVKPDVDKLTRAVLDALSGTIYKDDAQVTTITARKTYHETPGAWIQIIEETEPAK